MNSLKIYAPQSEWFCTLWSLHKTTLRIANNFESHKFAKEFWNLYNYLFEDILEYNGYFNEIWTLLSSFSNCISRLKATLLQANCYYNCESWERFQKQYLTCVLHMSYIILNFVIPNNRANEIYIISFHYNYLQDAIKV